MNRELLERQLRNIILAHGATRLKVSLEIGDDYWNYEGDELQNEGTYKQEPIIVRGLEANQQYDYRYLFEEDDLARIRKYPHLITEPAMELDLKIRAIERSVNED